MSRTAPERRRNPSFILKSLRSLTSMASVTVHIPGKISRNGPSISWHMARPPDSIDAAPKLVGQLYPNGTAALSTRDLADSTTPPPEEALQRMSSHLPPSEASSITQNSDDENYDRLRAEPGTIIPGSRGGGFDYEDKGRPSRGARTKSTPDLHESVQLKRLRSFEEQKVENAESALSSRQGIPIKLEKTDEKGRYVLTADNDPELREIIERLQVQYNGDRHRRAKFSDLVFTRQFTTFDMRNPLSAESPFHGFFTLFWLGVFMLILRTAGNNWQQYGSVFGRNQIVKLMRSKDLMLLGVTDAVMTLATGLCLLLQKAIVKGYINWSGAGIWIQSIWQIAFLVTTVGWGVYRDWPWTHMVFIVMHCLVYVMKQHSYAFYNGYLSECFKARLTLEKRLRQLADIEPLSPSSPTPRPTAFSTDYMDARSPEEMRNRRRSSIKPPKLTASLKDEKSDIAQIVALINSGEPLDMDQIDVFREILKDEIDQLNQELKGKCSETQNWYPQNLNVQNFVEYIPLPTLVYELEYPRQDSINWQYVFEKLTATFGVLGVMIVVSEAYMYPVVMRTVDMREKGMPLNERLQSFPWILMDLVFPFILEYLMSWYVIWECILNVLAELCRFADRGFYADWWNSVSWDQFARDWNRPVHNFLLRHVYHSSISAFHISRYTATLVTFLISAVIHELVMWCIFKKLRGYLLAMQMLQLPLVALSRTRLLKGRSTLGNVIFWVGMFTGPSFLCSLYLII